MLIMQSFGYKSIGFIRFGYDYMRSLIIVTYSCSFAIICRIEPLAESRRSGVLSSVSSEAACHVKHSEKQTAGALLMTLTTLTASSFNEIYYCSNNCKKIILANKMNRDRCIIK